MGNGELSEDDGCKGLPVSPRLAMVAECASMPGRVTMLSASTMKVLILGAFQVGTHTLKRLYSATAELKKRNSTKWRFGRETGGKAASAAWSIMILESLRTSRLTKSGRALQNRSMGLRRVMQRRGR